MAAADRRSGSAEQLLRDDHALDLVGALVDLGGLARPSAWCWVALHSTAELQRQSVACWRVLPGTRDETRGDGPRGRSQDASKLAWVSESPRLCAGASSCILRTERAFGATSLPVSCLCHGIDGGPLYAVTQTPEMQSCRYRATRWSPNPHISASRTTPIHRKSVNSGAIQVLVEVGIDVERTRGTWVSRRPRRRVHPSITAPSTPTSDRVRPPRPGQRPGSHRRPPVSCQLQIRRQPQLGCRSPELVSLRSPG